MMGAKMSLPLVPCRSLPGCGLLAFVILLRLACKQAITMKDSSIKLMYEVPKIP